MNVEHSQMSVGALWDVDQVEKSYNCTNNAILTEHTEACFVNTTKLPYAGYRHFAQYNRSVCEKKC